MMSHMEEPGRNPDAVRAFLAQHFGGPIAEVSSLGAGEWSQAFAFRWCDGDYVIRFSRFGEDFAKDRLAERFASPRLPIPRIVEIGEAFDGLYAVSARVLGESLDGLGRAAMRQVLPSILVTLDAIRETDVSGSMGYGLWGADGMGSTASWREALLDIGKDQPTGRMHGWRSQLAARPVAESAFNEAFAYLTALLEYCPEARHLVHADLLNNNVLVAGDQITGVLDWGSSKYGDFLYDLAWLTFWQPWYPAWYTIDFRQEAAQHYEAIGLDVPDFEQRLRCYEVHIGLASQAYNALKGRWAFVASAARRTLFMARGG